MEKTIKPKIENSIVEEQEKTTEKVTELGYGTLEKESGVKIPSHRKSGFMLTTFLAMGLALSFPTKAEAQFGIGGRGLGSRITRDVLTASKNAFEMSQNKKIAQVHEEYQEKLETLMEAEGKLDQEYHQQKLELRESGNEESLNQLEEEYRQLKLKFAQDRIKLEQDRDIKLAKIKIIRDAVGGGVRSVRGY